MTAGRSATPAEVEAEDDQACRRSGTGDANPAGLGRARGPPLAVARKLLRRFAVGDVCAAAAKKPTREDSKTMVSTATISQVLQGINFPCSKARLRERTLGSTTLPRTCLTSCRGCRIASTSAWPASGMPSAISNNGAHFSPQSSRGMASHPPSFLSRRIRLRGR